MEELRRALQERLKSCRKKRLNAGDYRDWDAATAAEAAEGELVWILKQIEDHMEIDTARLFKDEVTFAENVIFEQNVVFKGNVAVNGTLTTVKTDLR